MPSKLHHWYGQLLVQNLPAGDLWAPPVKNSSLDRVTGHQLEVGGTMPGCKIVGLVIACHQRPSGLQQLDVILLLKDT